MRYPWVLDATILLVEDSELCALIVRRALEAAGHSVVVARTASEALDKVKTQAFDVALVDSQLPDGDGAALTLPCPRILMSADPSPGVVTKSSDTAPLVDAVRGAIERLSSA